MNKQPNLSSSPSSSNDIGNTQDDLSTQRLTLTPIIEFTPTPTPKDNKSSNPPAVVTASKPSFLEVAMNSVKRNVVTSIIRSPLSSLQPISKPTLRIGVVVVTICKFENLDIGTC